MDQLTGFFLEAPLQLGAPFPLLLSLIVMRFRSRRV